MSAVAIPLSDLATTGRWQSDFVAIMPAIEKHAKICLRRLPREHREEGVAESIAVAWQSYRRLAHQGLLHRAFVGSLATFAVRHTLNGRHIGGRQDTAKDVLSPACQRRHSVHVTSLSSMPSGSGKDNWRSLVISDRKADIPDLACFRVDFAEWLRTLSRQDRRIVNRLAAGDGTMEVAERFVLTPSRISQLRRKYQRAWLSFQGEMVTGRAA